MEKTINRLVILGIIVGMIALTAMVLTQKSFGSAPSGLPATFATTSTVTVGNQTASAASSTIPVFTATNCASRSITTGSAEVFLLFSNTMISSTTANPSAKQGHLQTASTTVAYDSGQWGCGYVSGYSYASTTLTISEFR